MKHWNPFSSDKKGAKNAGSRLAFQGGSYSLAAAGTSVAALFMAAYLPAIHWALCSMVVAIILAP